MVRNIFFCDVKTRANISIFNINVKCELHNTNSLANLVTETGWLLGLALKPSYLFYSLCSCFPHLLNAFILHNFSFLCFFNFTPSRDCDVLLFFSTNNIWSPMMYFPNQLLSGTIIPQNFDVYILFYLLFIQMDTYILHNASEQRG